MPPKPITKDDFFRVVGQLGEEAKNRPKLFRLRVWLTVARGYWILFGLPLTFLVIGIIWFPLLIVGLAVAIASSVAMVRTLRVAFQEPKGLVLGLHTSPELFKMIESVRAELRAPPVDSVILTTEFNASLSEVPSLIFTGWKSYMTIGFPLTLGLSLDQCRALVAHELAHLANSHSRAKLSLIRLRGGAQRMLDGYARQRGWIQLLYNSLLTRYMPRLDACIYVLDREFESDCDLMAASASSARDVAEVLVRLNVLGSLEAIPFWTGVWKNAGENPSPPSAVYEALFAALRKPPNPSALVLFLQSALHRPTGPLDSHPSLAQRLANLGLSKTPEEIATWFAAPPAAPAVDAFFPNNRAYVLEQMNRAWVEMTAKNWAAQHASIGGLIETRRKLGDKAGSAQLTVEEMFGLANAIAQLDGMARAVPQFEALVNAAPDFLPGCEKFGTYLLAQGNPAGIALVERATQRNPLFRAQGYRALADFYARENVAILAARYQEFTAKASKEYDAAMQEGKRISVKDGLQAAGLGREQLDRIVAVAKQIPDLDRLYVLRKTVKILPEVPCYIFVATARRDWKHPFRNDPNFAIKLMIAMRSARLSPRSNFFGIQNKWRLMHHIAGIPGGEVYNSAENRAK